ncbi:unnamed protein product [Anisakis simplex]|uniref:Peptidase_M10 domain-containing protein n=1 Tax=Anisakis simplex TaxID=6269 RepID=A0A0M3J669_ANISI|nr:unnamed protein product [Anisakis simplex]
MYCNCVDSFLAIASWKKCHFVRTAIAEMLHMYQRPSHGDSCMDSELPSLAVLTTDRTSAELFGLKNKAAYFIECLELLGERDPQQLLNLIFIFPQQSENPRPVTWQSEECFETKRDVSVITSPVLKLLPDCVVAINKILWCTNQLEVRYCRSLPRVVSYKEVDANSFAVALRHTRGGAVASLLGAIVHEIGHLLKLPHTEHGIMKTGGDNIQTLFLSDKLLNLAISESDSAHPDVAVEFFDGDQEVVSFRFLVLFTQLFALLNSKLFEGELIVRMLIIVRLNGISAEISQFFCCCVRR